MASGCRSEQKLFARGSSKYYRYFKRFKAGVSLSLEPGGESGLYLNFRMPTGSYNPCAELTGVLAASCASDRKGGAGVTSAQKPSTYTAAKGITRQYRGHSGSSPVSG